MIRFIDLGDQILEGTKEFAWWNTITDSFMEFCGVQAWESWEEFERDFRHEDKRVYIVGEPDLYSISRFKGLFRWKIEHKE